MPSLVSRLVKIYARLRNFKAKSGSAQIFRASVLESRKQRPPAPTRTIKKYALITCDKFKGQTIYTLSPKGAAPKGHILFLHGGAYVFDLIKEHWGIVGRLLSELGCSISVPLYPLAPEHSCSEMYDWLISFYEEQISRYPAENLTLMGDSAGGGLSLGVSQVLKARGLPLPKRIVLLSPWLDVTMSHPEIPEIEPYDLILGTEGLKEAGRMFAGALPLSHPCVSPINGDMKGLPPISLFIGTHDILFPDCKRLRDLAEREGVPIDYHEYPEMLHVWVAVDMPESRDAFAMMKKDLLDEAAPR
jgi:epsilon-lactone hydrolase